MKIRQGFVSNSSSTSFYIDASKYSCEKIEEAIKRMLELLSFCQDSDAENINSVCTIGTASKDSIVQKMEIFYDYDGRKKEKFGSFLPNKIIAVDSVDDNSIPYCIQEFLCTAFNAERQHWG